MKRQAGSEFVFRAVGLGVIVATILTPVFGTAAASEKESRNWGRRA